MMDALIDYLQKTAKDQIAISLLAYMANLSLIAKVSPEIARSIIQELKDQRANIKLIASENYSSLSTQLAMGNLLPINMPKDLPHHRFYAGCDNVDAIEELAVKEACSLFHCDHAYVQPHSGADANLIAYWAILNKYVQTPGLGEVRREKSLGSFQRNNGIKSVM